MEFLEEWAASGPADDAAVAQASDTDLFDLELTRDFISRGRGTPVAVAVAGDTAVVATSRGFLIRTDLADAGAGMVQELDLQRAGGQACHAVYLDPSGTHCLAVCGGAGGTHETLYIDMQWKKARPLSKLKGLAVTAVGWRPSLDPQVTSEGVLVGLESGAVLSLEFGEGGKRDQTKQLHAVEDGPISGVAQVPLRTTGKLFVLVLSSSHLHCFCGGTALDDCFSHGPGSAIELPSEPGKTRMVLQRFPDEPGTAGAFVATAGSEDDLQPAKAVAVAMPGGVFHARLDQSRASASDPGAALTQRRFLPADLFRSETDEVQGIAFLRYHYAVLSSHALTLVNAVSRRPVQSIKLSRYAAPMRGVAELPLGLSPDASGSGRVFVWLGDDLFELDASREGRGMWRVFLEAGEFSAALLHADTPAQRAAVFLARGELAAADGDWEQAGELWGKVTTPTPSFEDLALRLVDAGRPRALQRFLETRLDTLRRGDAVQRTLVASWLLELLLDRQNRAALLAGAADAEDDPRAISEEIRVFLTTQHSVLDPGTTVALLTGHGQLELLEAYAQARGDHEALAELLVQRGAAVHALEVLRDPGVPEELTYRFAPALAALAPEASVAAWSAVQPPLDPERLLPALLALSAGGAEGRAAALGYIRGIIARGCAVPALHGLALDLLTSSGVPEEELLDYLATARTPLGTPLFDAVMALRLARERGRDRAAVVLLRGLGMDAEAVQLALGFDRELAAAVAREVGDRDVTLARKLWMDIARHVLHEEQEHGHGEAEEGAPDAVGDSHEAKEISRVTALLEESRGVLRIEDVLPLFPDFVRIDAFKGVLCTALESYNQEIEDVKHEMALSAKTAHAIRQSLGQLDARTAVVDGLERCARCGRALQDAPPATPGYSGRGLPRLYLFPTGNGYHGPCLAAEVAALAPALLRRRIQGAMAEVAAGREAARNLTELEADIAREDPHWGEAMVRHVRAPFISPEESAAELESWAL